MRPVPGIAFSMLLFLLAIVKISLGTYEAGFFRVSIDVLPPGANPACASCDAPRCNILF